MKNLKFIDSAHKYQSESERNFDQSAYAVVQIGLSLTLFAREARRQESIHIPVRPTFDIKWSGREYMEREQERLNSLVKDYE